MKTLLLCPTHRPTVARLAEAGPLALSSILGKTVVEYWLEHLASKGEQAVRVIALDRPDRVRELVGDGSRWGLHAEVLPENGEPAPPEARLHRDGCRHSGENAPGGVITLDHLPGLPQLPLFESYEGWYQAAQFLLPLAQTPERIGRREIQPGVSIGLQTRVSRSARLEAPCWIGDNVYIGPEAHIGPRTIIENRAFVGSGARIADSVIGPDTFVGEFTCIRRSIAQGNLLINWQTRSCLDVPEAFLLCSLAEPQAAPKVATRLRSPLVPLHDLIPRSQG